MLISHFVEGVAEEFESLAELGGEELVAAVRRLSAASSSVLATQLLGALNEVVAEFNARDTATTLELRLAGDDVSLVPSDDREPAGEASGELSARIALRLPEDLKARIESLASKSNVSTNAWIVRTLHHATERPVSTPRTGNYLRGTGRS